VEERLNFFETGAPPSKNMDAIRKVLEDLAIEDHEDEEMDDAEPVLTTLEPSPSPKKEKKKKRKHEAMDEEEEEEVSSKKSKLSKEEKRALKRAKKEAMKREKAVVVDVSLFAYGSPSDEITETTA
jgi:nucleolar protein 56